MRSPIGPLLQPQGVGPGRLRKVALVGGAPTLVDAPWHDPSWEIWSHTSCWQRVKRADRWFELHSEDRWRERKNWHPDYQSWLQAQTVPVYMQRRVKGIPASIAYPKDRVLAEFPGYFTGQTAWMVALALTEGVTHLGFYGIHYSYASEYASQRAGCEFWMGVAVGRGVQIVVPTKAPLLKEPPALYGYQDVEFHAWIKSWRHQLATNGRTITPADQIQVTQTLPPLPHDAPEHMARARQDEFWMMKTPTSKEPHHAAAEIPA